MSENTRWLRHQSDTLRPLLRTAPTSAILHTHPNTEPPVEDIVKFQASYEANGTKGALTLTYTKAEVEATLTRRLKTVIPQAVNIVLKEIK